MVQALGQHGQHPMKIPKASVDCLGYSVNFPTRIVKHLPLEGLVIYKQFT